LRFAKAVLFFFASVCLLFFVFYSWLAIMIGVGALHLYKQFEWTYTLGVRPVETIMCAASSILSLMIARTILAATKPEKKDDE
jgi:hypothetical protein